MADDETRWFWINVVIILFALCGIVQEKDQCDLEGRISNLEDKIEMIEKGGIDD